MIGRGVLTALPFIGPFCVLVGAQSTAQSWDPCEEIERSALVFRGHSEERSLKRKKRFASATTK